MRIPQADSVSCPRPERSAWQVGLSRNVAALAGASSVSVLLTIGAAPVLTRLYAPADIGAFGVFISVLLVLTAPATLRYEFAIPVADSDKDAVHIAAVALIAATLAALAVLTLSSCWTANTWTRLPGGLMLPLGMVAMAAFQVLHYWTVRRGEFSTLGAAAVGRSATESALQIALGIVAASPFGLIAAAVASYFIGAVFLVALGSVRRGIRHYQVSLRDIGAAFVRYRRYAIFSTPSAVLNAAGGHAPAMLIAATYGPTCAGWFLLADRIFSLPSRIVGRAVSDVYFGETARLLRQDPQELRRLLRDGAKRLMPITVATLLGALASGPAFATIFGAEWKEAGVYCMILAAYYAARFFALSLTQLTTYGLNHWQLGWDVCRLPFTCIPLVTCFYLGLPARAAIASFGAASVLAFMALYFLNLQATRSTAARLAGGVAQ